jgi:hypothetical protein
MGKDERGTLRLLDDVGDGKGLSAARDPEQDLVFGPVAEALDELFDRLGLVPLWLVIGYETERHPFNDKGSNLLNKNAGLLTGIRADQAETLS